MSGFQLCVTSHSSFNFKMCKIVHVYVILLLLGFWWFGVFFFFLFEGRNNLKNKPTHYGFNPVVVVLG